MKQMILTAALVMGVFSFTGVQLNAENNNSNVNIITENIISQDDFKDVKAEDLSAVIQEKLKVYAESNEIKALAYSAQLDLVRVNLISLSDKTESIVYLDKEGKEVELPATTTEQKEETM